MHYGVRTCCAFRGRYTPLGRRGSYQHQPRGCTGLPQDVEETPHRMRSIGILIAVFFVTGCLHELHACPVRIQLVRHDARQRRPAPASHLRAVRDDVRGSIRIDRQVHVRPPGSLGHAIRICGSSQQLLRHEANAQYKCARSEHAFEESAPVTACFTIAARNIVDMNHAPSLRHRTKMAAKSGNTRLHPTANPFSCKPGGREAWRASGSGVRRSGKSGALRFWTGQYIL